MVKKSQLNQSLGKWFGLGFIVVSGLCLACNEKNLESVPGRLEIVRDYDTFIEPVNYFIWQGDTVASDKDWLDISVYFHCFYQHCDYYLLELESGGNSILAGSFQLARISKGEIIFSNSIPRGDWPTDLTVNLDQKLIVLYWAEIPSVMDEQSLYCIDPGYPELTYTFDLNTLALECSIEENWWVN